MGIGQKGSNWCKRKIGLLHLSSIKMMMTMMITNINIAAHQHPHYNGKLTSHWCCTLPQKLPARSPRSCSCSRPESPSSEVWSRHCQQNGIDLWSQPVQETKSTGQDIIIITNKVGLIYDHNLLKRPRALILVIWLSARIRWVVVVGIPDGISWKVWLLFLS